MEKVKLPKEVAKSIEDLREIGADNWDIVFTFASGDEYHNHLVEFAKEHTDRFLQALVNGYEIEMTPEERALDYYETLERLMNEATAKNNRSETMALANKRVGARNILNMLGIKIEGINA